MRVQFDIEHRTCSEERRTLMQHIVAVVGPQSICGGDENPDGQHDAAAVKQRVLKAAEHAEFRTLDGRVFVGLEGFRAGWNLHGAVWERAAWTAKRPSLVPRSSMWGIR